MDATPDPSMGFVPPGPPSMLKLTVPVGVRPPADSTVAVTATGAPGSDGFGVVATVIVDSTRSTH